MKTVLIFGGTISDARTAVAHMAARELGVPVAHIARHFGLSGSAVSMMLGAGKKIAEERGLVF